MAKHRFPLRVRAAREGIRSGRRLVIIGATILAMGGAGVGIAMASSVPSNFPGNTGTSCDAWHGAPGGFGPDSPYYTVSGAQGGIGGQTFGGDQGVVTGDNNSSYSAACNG